MTSPLEALASGGQSILGRTLTHRELDTFDKYLKLLQKWQKTQRLIGAADGHWIVEHLFLDSLLFLKVLPPGISSIADVGSGAGVPGIPLKIARPDLRMTLIESRAKRASFLAAAVRDLELNGVEVVSTRLEHYAQQRPGEFDAVVMRCAGDFGPLARAASSLVVPGGLVIASGPPAETALRVGAWVEGPGVAPGSHRRFAVYRRS